MSVVSKGKEMAVALTNLNPLAPLIVTVVIVVALVAMLIFKEANKSTPAAAAPTPIAAAPAAPAAASSSKPKRAAKSPAPAAKSYYGQPPPHTGSHTGGGGGYSRGGGGSSGGGGGYSGGGGFSLVNPPRYLPSALPSALPQHEQIGVHESAEVKDDTGRFQAGLRAVLDTGNAGCTLITERAARHLGLVDSHGVPTDYHAHKVNGLRQTVSCRGVVAGAKDVLPALLLSYRIKGKEMKNVVAAVTKADLGADLCAG
jgi:hypothetical protein